MEQNRSIVKLTMVIVMITSFMAPFMGNAINLGIPQMALEFGVGQSLLNWVVTSYLLATAAFLLPFGRLADIMGRKKVFIFGMFLFALTALGCGFAFSFPMLIIFRVLQGIASAMIFGTSMAILTSVVPPKERGKAMGLSAATTYIGLSLGPVLGGMICSTIGWRGIFYFTFILSLVVLSLTLAKLSGEWLGAVDKFDTWGGILWTFGIVLFLYGLTDITAGFQYMVTFILGLALIIAFVVYETKISNPLLPIRMFMNNRSFTFSNLAALINYSATFALTFLMSLYLQNVQNIGISQSGLILLSQPILMAALSPLAGRLSDRINSQILASLGMAITTLGLFLFIFLDEKTSILLVIINLAFIGLGFAFFSSPNSNAVMSSVDRTLYGVASSTLGTMRLLGQTLSMTIVALITSLGMKDLTLDSPDYVTSFLQSSKTSFIVFTVLCCIGIFASLARGKKMEA
ncbi:MFS transporter [Desulfosporosinus youngiae]|uniref:Arabinose efflux permease family protein n=1 Tax=Desulfosporosinus youngiae DSM 17734 TaxID=768710 RepID=H5XZA2_9FIRM|nr:MFS transporter [Desulfosporosinus youngiae]EHQ91808.1 arabinose efflux permease family protein [Desulfosporosinus youngiae DSM 17734]